VLTPIIGGPGVSPSARQGLLFARRRTDGRCTRGRQAWIGLVAGRRIVRRRCHRLRCRGRNGCSCWSTGRTCYRLLRSAPRVRRPTSRRIWRPVFFVSCVVEPGGALSVRPMVAWGAPELAFVLNDQVSAAGGAAGACCDEFTSGLWMDCWRARLFGRKTRVRSGWQPWWRMPCPLGSLVGGEKLRGHQRWWSDGRTHARPSTANWCWRIRRRCVSR